MDMVESLQLFGTVTFGQEMILSCLRFPVPSRLSLDLWSSIIPERPTRLRKIALRSVRRLKPWIEENMIRAAVDRQMLSAFCYVLSEELKKDIDFVDRWEQEARDG